jgi:hypothetical protein
MAARYSSDCSRKNAPVFRAGAWAAFFLLCYSVLPAQSGVTFEAAISAKEVIVGVPFELTFTLKNAEGARFTPPAFSGFQAGGISEMRGMSIVNGRSSTTQSWSLNLTAVKPGVYTIGPASVVAGRQTLQTKPLTVKVLSLAASSKGNVQAPPGDDKVFIAAEFDRKEAYIGQQVTWRVRLYTQLSVDGYDLIALPDFNDFYSREKVRFDKRVEYLTLKGKKYAVRTLYEEALFPQKEGEQTIGPARISVGIEQPGTQGFFFGPKPVTLQTQPVSIDVKTLPAPAPETFTGGVGTYSWDVKADTNALTTDDALTITVEITGNGDARRFAAPRIRMPAGCEIFEPRILEEEEYESETEILHRKKFEFVVLPKDTGTLEIVPEMAYLDVDSNRYCVLKSASIRFVVTPGQNYQPPGSIPESSAVESVKPRDPGFFEQMTDWLNSPVLWGILALPFLALGLIALFRKRKHTPAPVREPAAVPTPKADVSQARQRFAEAGRLLQGNDPRRFYDELFRALRGWLSARLGLEPAQLNDADISRKLLQHGATPIRTQALLSVWHTCEQAIYGGQAQSEHMETTYRLAEQVLDALEREVR